MQKGKLLVLFVFAGFNSKLQFLGVEVSEADSYMPAQRQLGRNRNYSNKSLKQLQYSSASFHGKGADMMFANF